MNLVDEIKKIVKNKTVEVPTIRDELQKLYPKADVNDLRNCIVLIAKIDTDLSLDETKSEYKYFTVSLIAK